MTGRYGEGTSLLGRGERQGEGFEGRPREHDLAWEQAIELFLQSWAADRPGIRPATLEHYREQLASRIAAFARQQGIARVQDFDRYDLRAFVPWLDRVVTYAGRPLTPRGKQMALGTAKRFLGWLYREGLLPEDLGARVNSYRLDTDPEPRATPGPDLEQVMRAVDLSRPTGVRNLAMIHLMAFCGLRVAELVGLDAGDLDLEAGRVRVKAATSKVRRARFVDLPLMLSEGREVVKPEVAQVLARWLGIRSEACPHLGEGDALFVTLGPNQMAYRRRQRHELSGTAPPPRERLTIDAVRTILWRLAARAGVDPPLVTPHRLRHYLGLRSAMAGVPTTALMRAMGHRSPIMTARYSEFADSERRCAFARADIAGGIALPAPALGR